MAEDATEVDWVDIAGFLCIFLVVAVMFVAGLGRLLLWRWNTIPCLRCCCRPQRARERRGPKPAAATRRHHPECDPQTGWGASGTGVDRVTGCGGTRQTRSVDVTGYGGGSGTRYASRSVHNAAVNSTRFTEESRQPYLDDTDDAYDPEPLAPPAPRLNRPLLTYDANRYDTTAPATRSIRR